MDSKCRTMQAALNARYEQLRNVTGITVQQQSKMSAPLCVHVFPEWLDSNYRLLVVGQETYDWRVSSDYHGPNGLVCSPCSYPVVSNFAEWKVIPSSTEALLHVYETFNFAATQAENWRSPFWRAYRELVEPLEGNAMLRKSIWSNVFRMDWQGGSTLKAPREVLQAIRAAQKSVLRDEIAILKPEAVVFFTGPNYDQDVKLEFEGVKYRPVADRPERQFAQLEHDILPQKSFRTYHPAYLQRSNKWCYLDELRNRILG